LIKELKRAGYTDIVGVNSQAIKATKHW